MFALPTVPVAVTTQLAIVVLPVRIKIAVPPIPPVPEVKEPRVIATAPFAAVVGMANVVPPLTVCSLPFVSQAVGSPEEF